MPGQNDVYKNRPSGQYFRAFKNFGAPIAPSSPHEFFTRNRIAITPDTLRGIELDSKRRNMHPYWYLVCSCLRAAYSNLRYIPFVVYRQYQLNKGKEIE